ncbi:hypothetical protein [Pseudomonas xantholysinigenes]|uniref:Uncharacterized protein n=1 Tax=Pseudomonas xantholysinigenes TaxID=2745490 RepID=A0A9E6U0H9_9PSED|nr:hypothetical protein [Pseudomonas xantholysinigenes]QXI40989.1 hypothetical protein HU772_019140 [Pseudomonas xantholysinigenes]
MRIDGFSSSSYPIKRPPRKAPVRDEAVDEADAEIIDDIEAQVSRASRRSENLPARQQDLIFPRARDRRTSSALASYLTTAGFTDWEMEVLGLDLYI